MARRRKLADLPSKRLFRGRFVTLFLGARSTSGVERERIGGAAQILFGRCDRQGELGKAPPSLRLTCRVADMDGSGFAPDAFDGADAVATIG